MGVIIDVPNWIEKSLLKGILQQSRKLYVSIG